MKKSHFVVSYGYECHPEFPTLAQARAVLKALQKESLAKCRKRFGSCTRLEADKDSFKITFGCNLWSAAHIQSL